MGSVAGTATVATRGAFAGMALMAVIGCQGVMNEAGGTPTTRTDSGSAQPDAGTVALDSGTPPPDAGTSPMDSGTLPRDAGVGTAGRTPWPMGTRYIQSGHSLTDTVMAHPYPGRLVEAVMLDAAGDFSDVAKSTIPGSPIRWRWTHSEGGSDQAAEWPEEIGDYQGLVITLAVPLYADDRIRQTEQVEWLQRAVDDAWANGRGGNGAETLLYTTWTQLEADPAEPHPEDHLDFRTRLNLDQGRWEAMQDFVNTNRPAGQALLYLIPGHRLMMRLVDDIEAGASPFGSLDQLFSDSIHPNDIGSYAVTLLHYACIYGRDPGAFLPDRLAATDRVTPTQAAYFKRVVREVVTTYARTGLTSLAAR